MIKTDSVGAFHKSPPNQTVVVDQMLTGPRPGEKLLINTAPQPVNTGILGTQAGKIKFWHIAAK
jgi:hypothetical protein